jgi:hypothetical protein
VLLEGVLFITVKSLIFCTITVTITITVTVSAITITIISDPAAR